MVEPALTNLRGMYYKHHNESWISDSQILPSQTILHTFDVPVVGPVKFAEIPRTRNHLGEALRFYTQTSTFLHTGLTSSLDAAKR